MKTCLLNKFLTCRTSASLPLSTRSLSLTTSSSRSLSSVSPASASSCPRLHQHTSRRQAPASTSSVARMKTAPCTSHSMYCMYCTVLYRTVPAPPARTCTCPGSPSPAGSGQTPILGVEFKFMHNNNFPLAGQGLLWIILWQHGWTFCENKIIIMAMSHKNTCPWIGGPLRVRRYIALPCPLTKLSDDGVEAGLRGHVYEAAAEAVVREHEEHLLAV